MISHSSDTITDDDDGREKSSGWSNADRLQRRPKTRMDAEWIVHGQGQSQ